MKSDLHFYNNITNRHTSIYAAFAYLFIVLKSHFKFRKIWNFHIKISARHKENQLYLSQAVVPRKQQPPSHITCVRLYFACHIESMYKFNCLKIKQNTLRGIVTWRTSVLKTSDKLRAYHRGKRCPRRTNKYFRIFSQGLPPEEIKYITVWWIIWQIRMEIDRRF